MVTILENKINKYSLFLIAILLFSGCGKQFVITPIENRDIHRSKTLLLKTGNISNDNKPDFVYWSALDRKIRYVVSTTDGFLHVESENDFFAIKDIVIADINKDGIDDVVLLSEGKLYSIIKEDVVTSLLDTNECTEIYSLHANNDDLYDLMCRNSNQMENILVLLGNGKGNFVKESPLWLQALKSDISVHLGKEPTFDYNGFNLDEYTVGPGDNLEIIIWKSNDFELHKVKVRPDGRFSVALVPDFLAQGYTAEEIDDQLTDHLKEYFVNPNIDVSIKEYAYYTVNLYGAINRIEGVKSGPGKYVLEKPTRIVELIAQGGGISPTADLSHVVITRKKGETIFLNLTFAYADITSVYNVYVLPGDLIYIQDKEFSMWQVYAMGRISKTGAIPVHKGARLLEAIRVLGNFDEFAELGDAKIIRKVNGKDPVYIPIDVERLLEGDTNENIELQNGDILFVP